MSDFATLGMDVDSRGLTKGQRELRNLEKQAARTERGVGKASALMSRGLVAVGVAAATLFSGGALVRGISQFEESMSRVGAVSRASGKDLQAMRKIALEMGSTTEFSASQAADGLNFLAMAGFDAQESIAALPQVLDLATASGLGLAQSADIASNVISGFGLAATDAAEVADTLAAASSRANTDVGQLGQAMSTVAPIAASLDISVQDTAAAIGVLSDAGIQGARAGTAMRGVLASLAGPTDQAREAIESYGLAVEDVNPETNSLAEIMGRLEEAGLTTADAMTIFGREAASGALALVDANQRVGELTGQLEGAKGAAGDMADTMRDNLGGDIKGLMSALEGLILALGDAGLTAVLRGVVNTITRLVRAFSTVVNGAKEVVTAVGDFLNLTDANRRMGRAIDNATLAMGDQITEVQTLDALLGNSNKLTLESAKAHLEAASARRDEIQAMKEKQVLAAKEALGWNELSARISSARLEIEELESVQLRAAEAGKDLPEGLTGGAEELAASMEVAQRRLAQLLSKQQEYKSLLESQEYLSDSNKQELATLEADIAKISTAIENSKNGIVAMNGGIVQSNGLGSRLSDIMSNIPGYVSAGSQATSVLADTLSAAARAAASLAEQLASAVSYLPGVRGLMAAFSGSGEGVGGLLSGIGTQLEGMWEGVMRSVNAPEISIPSGSGAGGGAGGGGGGARDQLSVLDQLLNGVTEQTPREKIEAWHEEVMTALNDANLKERGMLQKHSEYKLEIERLYQDQLRELQAQQQAQRLGEAADFFGSMQSLAQEGGEGAVKAAKVFGAARALINTFIAQSDVLADPTLGFFGKLAAYAKIGAAGFGLVNAIKSSSTSSSGTPGGTAAASAGGSEAAAPRIVLNVQPNERGDVPMETFTSTIDTINDELNLGGRIVA